MATVQTDGSSSVTSSSTKNNSGTFTAAGSSTSAVLASQKSATEIVSAFGSVVYDGSDADKALSAGTFSYNNQKPTGMKVSTTISGTSNTFLRSGANDTNNRRSIHKLEKVRTRRITTAIRNNKWNEYTGEWEAGFPVNAVDNFWDIAAATGVATSTDQAAAPSMSIPGELVYKGGNPNPVLADYKAKTN